MTLLPAFMLILTLTVLLTVVPRTVFSWQQFSELAAVEDRDGLLELLRQENEWIVRHFVCAAAGTALVALLETMPGLNPPEYLTEMIGGYVLLSFALALLESLLAQKIAQLTQAVPVRVRSDEVGTGSE